MSAGFIVELESVVSGVPSLSTFKIRFWPSFVFLIIVQIVLLLPLMVLRTLTTASPVVRSNSVLLMSANSGPFMSSAGVVVNDELLLRSDPTVSAFEMIMPSAES